LQLAAHPATVRRALVTALIVGVVLIAINHGPALLSGELTLGRLAQMLLTLLVPYVVSTVSSVSTRRELAPMKSLDGRSCAGGHVPVVRDTES
jgi:hypothetical protein